MLNNLEANLLQNDEKTLGVTKKFLSYLLKQSQRYDEVSLPDKGVSKASKSLFREFPLDNYKIPSNIESLNVDFTIPIRFQPKSSLNLTFGLGRKDKKGFYKIRPYYEVEITIQENNG